MSFEPLKTDEKLEQPVEKKRDMDTVMLGGCAAFVFTSMMTFLLGIWPFLVFGESHLLRILTIDLVCASVPSLVFGIITTRKFKLPGACGYVGGSLSVMVFIHLRLNMILTMIGSPELPQPEYPVNWQWVIPLIWIGVSVISCAIVFPDKQDFE